MEVVEIAELLLYFIIILFRCLVFGTDGLWNVITAASAIEIVRSAEMMNEMNVNNGLASDWKNPSRFLVETALDRWAITKMRADNTSVVNIIKYQ